MSDDFFYSIFIIGWFGFVIITSILLLVFSDNKNETEDPGARALKEMRRQQLQNYYTNPIIDRLYISKKKD